MNAVIVVLCLVAAAALVTAGVRLVIRYARVEGDPSVPTSSVLLMLFGGIATYLLASAPLTVAGMLIFTGRIVW
jgi:hypothetical protein